MDGDEGDRFRLSAGRDRTWLVARRGNIFLSGKAQIHQQKDRCSNREESQAVSRKWEPLGHGVNSSLLKLRGAGA